MLDTSLNTSAESSRREPLHISNPASRLTLNETLNAEYIDIPSENSSAFANITRCVAGVVGSYCTPRQVLIILRILKAVTFAFLVFTIVADLMYIFFVQLKTSEEVNAKVGGTRDFIIRIYGVVLTVFALMVELDTTSVKNFAGLKSFIPRACLLFFVATISSSPPLHKSYQGKRDGDDDNAYYDDDGSGYAGDGSSYSDQQVSQEIPLSTVIFQMVTSLVVGCCAIVYLVLGLLCVDRLRAKAFLSSRNPLVSTAIPSTVAQQPSEETPGSLA